uniref:Terpene synthase n=1 Tax=Psidium guajava TaxID=120290 RepID=A0AA95ZAF8_PSIGU|nr:terpene synthase [Psidium guajava]
MALPIATFAFFQGPFASNADSQTDKIKRLQGANSLSSTNNKWSISSHQTLVSTPFKEYIRPTGKRNYAVEDDIRGRHERRLQEVKQLFKQVTGDSLESLVMVDALQRLAIDYHFEDEIEALLQRHFLISTSRYHSLPINAENLHEAALRFRLLRQGGYPVPSDVFQHFLYKMNGGTEKRNPQDNDILGLTSLFEASHLGTDGEDGLDKLRESIGQRLHASLADLDHLQARIVRNSLGNPFHRSLARFTAGDFLRNLGAHSYGWTNNLGELAHLDMNIARSVHQCEVLQISNWWEELGIVKELKYARDQPMKWYMWPMAILTDTGLSQERVLTTKAISFIYIIDDIFDIYGTIDELASFTDVVIRWECTEKDNIPEYMRMCFHALDDITNEISFVVYKNHGWDPLSSLRKTWATLLNAFLVEARWLARGHYPTTQEYMDNAIVSSGVHVLLVHLFFLLGERIDPQSVHHLENIPEIVSSTASILRLWDDLGSAKDEFQDGRDGSYVECYKQEFQGSSDEVARGRVKEMISEAWKRLNKACLHPHPLAKSFTKAALNTARMVRLMYDYDDNHSLPLLENHMNSLLFRGPSF